MPTLFTRIINGELPGTFVWQDERCVAMMRSFIATRPELWNEDIGV